MPLTDTPVMRSHGPSNDNTGATYSGEFRMLAAEFAPYVRQLERCLTEIDRIAKDYEHDEQRRLQQAANPECMKSEKERAAADAKAREINTTLKTFGAWRQHPYKSPYGEFDIDVFEAMGHAGDAENLVWMRETLLSLYLVKTKQQRANPLLVKSNEAQLETIRSFLSDSIRSSVPAR